MRNDLLVYISGPMTAKDGRTIEQNTADGVAVYLDLLKRGIPAFCPHLSGAFPSAWTALSHAEWIAYDCVILDRCTHLLMMPRWETSAGARMELEYWLKKGVCANPGCGCVEEARSTVMYSVEDLLAAIGD